MVGEYVEDLDKAGAGAVFRGYVADWEMDRVRAALDPVYALSIFLREELKELGMLEALPNSSSS